MEPYADTRGALLQNMMNSRYVGQRHYVDFVRFYLAEQRWSMALQLALQGMTQYPNSSASV